SSVRAGASLPGFGGDRMGVPGAPSGPSKTHCRERTASLSAAAILGAKEVAMPDTVRFWLHVEGAAALVAGAVLYHALGGEWLWLIPLLLVPDLSIAAYVAGPAIGSFVYNVVHNWA